MEKEDSIRILFAHACSYYQSWTEAELEWEEERWREWELRSLKEWPDTTPYDDPPDGLDEFEKVGCE